MVGGLINTGPWSCGARSMNDGVCWVDGDEGSRPVFEDAPLLCHPGDWMGRERYNEHSHCTDECNYYASFCAQAGVECLINICPSIRLAGQLGYVRELCNHTARFVLDWSAVNCENLKFSGIHTV